MKPIELLNEDGHTLWEEAGRLAATKDSVFAAHVIIDSHCSIKPQCLHCNWRARDKVHTNYRERIPVSDVVLRAQQAKQDGLEILYLVTGCIGEDPPDFVYDYVAAVKASVDIETYCMLGPVSSTCLKRLRDAGLDGYYCGLESPNRDIYSRIRPGDQLVRRIETLRAAQELGMKTWSGFILGLGENVNDIADGIDLLKELNPDVVSFGQLHPAAYTELEGESVPRPFEVAQVMATTRIYLDKIDLFTGYHFIEWGFIAGCNGVCSPNAYFSINASEVERLRAMRQRTLKRIH